MIRAAHALLEALKVRILNQLFVADNLVHGFNDVESFLLRVSEFVLSLAVFRHVFLLVIQTDVLPINKVVEP